MNFPLKASLVASLAIGTTFLLSPISSILVDKFGIRKTAFTGGFIATLGMFLSSFAVDRVSFSLYYLFKIQNTQLENARRKTKIVEFLSNHEISCMVYIFKLYYENLIVYVIYDYLIWISLIFQIEWLYLTYGIMFGGGSSLTYTPSLVILGHYFKRHMGMVNGFVTTGSSIFTLAMPHILEGLLSSCGVSQGRLKRWTSQLDLGNTSGGLETLVLVHKIHNFGAP